MTKVVFFGNERLVSGLPKTEAPILSGLIARGYDVVAVVSHHSESQSRSQRELEVAAIATAHAIPLFLPNKPSEIIDEIRALNADIAVLAAYGRIVSQSVIDLFAGGIINIHPSLLPKYRGPTPIESAIMNRDAETGVSIMQLSAAMDEGPVYAQATVILSGHETKTELYEQLSRVGSSLFFDNFASIIDGLLKPTPQDNTVATYSNLIQKNDSTINWNQDAVTIEAQIRAYEGWPQSRTTLGRVEVIITEVEVLEAGFGVPGELTIQSDSLIVATGTGSIKLICVKPLGKKEMPIQAFLSGYRSLLSID